MLQRINNLKMCYFALYNNGIDKLQGNRNVYATFNSLYLVSSNILLAHRRTVAKFLYNSLMLMRANEALRATPVGKGILLISSS